jgi:hypothetical protein
MTPKHAAVGGARRRGRRGGAGWLGSLAGIDSMRTCPQEAHKRTTVKSDFATASVDKSSAKPVPPGTARQPLPAVAHVRTLPKPNRPC